MVWREKERSTIETVKEEKFRVFLSIRRINRMPDVLVRDSCSMKNWVDKRSNESVLQRFGNIENVEK